MSGREACSHRSRSVFHDEREPNVKPGASLQVLSCDEVLVAMRARRQATYHGKQSVERVVAGEGSKRKDRLMLSLPLVGL